MTIGWLTQTAADMPASDAWLSANELIPLSSLAFPKRRADWRLGRWTAKHTVSTYLNLGFRSEDDLQRIEIRTRRSGAPEVLIDGSCAEVTISLSHRAGNAICALAAGRIALGCDLELVEPRADSFTTDYFTASEQALIEAHPEGERAALLTILWSAKESALKALQCGLRMDTLRLEVTLEAAVAGMNALQDHGDSWNLLQLTHLPTQQAFYGGWQRHSDFIRTIVSVHRSGRLVDLHHRRQAPAATGLLRPFTAAGTAA